MRSVKLYATCLDVSGAGRLLTKDKVYQVHDIRKRGDDSWLLLKNDQGDRGEYNANRFKVTTNERRHQQGNFDR